MDEHRGKSLIEAPFLDHHIVGRAVLTNKLPSGTMQTTVISDKESKNASHRNAKYKLRRENKKSSTTK